MNLQYKSRIHGDTVSLDETGVPEAVCTAMTTNDGTRVRFAMPIDQFYREFELQNKEASH